MKFFLVATLFLLSVSCVFSLKIDFNHGSNPHKDCAHHHHHFPTGKIEKLNKGEPVDVSDTETASHLVCILKERNILSEDGKINKDVMRTRITRIIGAEHTEDIEKTVNCLEQKEDQKETAVTFYNCVAPMIKIHNSS